MLHSGEDGPVDSDEGGRGVPSIFILRGSNILRAILRNCGIKVWQSLFSWPDFRARF